MGLLLYTVVRYHFRLRSDTTSGQQVCFEMFKTIAEVLRIEVFTASLIGLLVCISSLSVTNGSLSIRTGPCCLPGAIQYDATDMIQ